MVHADDDAAATAKMQDGLGGGCKVALGGERRTEVEGLSQMQQNHARAHNSRSSAPAEP